MRAYAKVFWSYAWTIKSINQADEWNTLYKTNKKTQKPSAVDATFASTQSASCSAAAADPGPLGGATTVGREDEEPAAESPLDASSHVAAAAPSAAAAAAAAR